MAAKAAEQKRGHTLSFPKWPLRAGSPLDAPEHCPHFDCFNQLIKAFFFLHVPIDCSIEWMTGLFALMNQSKSFVGSIFGHRRCALSWLFDSARNSVERREKQDISLVRVCIFSREMVVIHHGPAEQREGGNVHHCRATDFYLIQTGREMEKNKWNIYSSSVSKMSNVKVRSADNSCCTWRSSVSGAPFPPCGNSAFGSIRTAGRTNRVNFIGGWSKIISARISRSAATNVRVMGPMWVSGVTGRSSPMAASHFFRWLPLADHCEKKMPKMWVVMTLMWWLDAGQRSAHRWLATAVD